jgi:hypothetical protein
LTKERAVWQLLRKLYAERSDHPEAVLCPKEYEVEDAGLADDDTVRT